MRYLYDAKSAVGGERGKSCLLAYEAQIARQSGVARAAPSANLSDTQKEEKKQIRGEGGRFEPSTLRSKRAARNIYTTCASVKSSFKSVF